MQKNEIHLSDEQQLFINEALLGKNIIVDACIGSGKTTAIQELCNRFPSNKSICYLTYNKLLKVDAKSRIKAKNVFVTNYHGFAYNALISAGIHCGISDLIQQFISVRPEIKSFDVLVLDEYQDIDQEISEMLDIIKFRNPGMQIVAVGDMEQKIYDKTTLDVRKFIDRYLDKYEALSFTKCFRLNAEHAAMLGRIWGKRIEGVNDNCYVHTMNPIEVKNYLAKQNPEDVLCLGMRTGQMAEVLNRLEEEYPDKYNKKTVYASIRDKGLSGATEPKKTSAIFTTYDSSKGLERKICVVFDYTMEYWYLRIKKAQIRYEIMRNIFCVAASRGKDEIIFVNSGAECLLPESVISVNETEHHDMEDVNISEMFDFKYKEDVEECFSLLNTRLIEQEDISVIHARTSDELIDLSPCIGICQEAIFFKNYDIDKEILMYMNTHKGIPEWKKRQYAKLHTIDEKVLFYTSLETSQERYVRQVNPPLMSKHVEGQIMERLSSVFNGNEQEQVECSMLFQDIRTGELFEAKGLADVVKNGTVYELKFVSELTHEHFLQCASYMLALELNRGILWNTRDNTMYEIHISNKLAFSRAVKKTATKHMYI